MRIARWRRVGAWLVGVSLGGLIVATGCDQLRRERSLGETVWRKQCAECHGVDGAGKVLKYSQYAGTDLLDDHWEYGAEPFEMENTIREGIFPTMPAFEELSDEEVQAVVAYIGQLRGGR